MALHDIDAVHDRARPDGTRATADLTQAAAVVELENLLGSTCTRNDADGAGFRNAVAWAYWPLRPTAENC